ncbi:hypothetical protein C0992_006310 [Termitomyces sp. T32_za158]|nr:hypothetical protein C0992_006310 [Termitomyces sp. T32_za158]
MDNKDAPRPRRPLPIPGAPPAQRPNTPVPAALDSSVAPSSFYGKSPPLPTRPQPIGSHHTTYVPPNDPPPYGSSSVTAFREPELVVEEPTESISASNDGWQTMPASYWDTQTPAASTWQNDPWESNNVGTDGWPNRRDNYEDYDPMAFINVAKSHVDVAVSGRDDYEEKHWWDPALRSKEARPGPGMIPTMLADELHDPDHSLFSVLVSNPDIKPLLVPSTDQSADQSSTNAWSSAQPSPSCPPATSTTAPPPPPPTDSDVRTAVPHPNAYYCPKENGWVILSWKSSSVSPPYATSFKESPHPPLPDQERRRRLVSCVDNGVYSVHNKTHHFHKYEKAVDSHKLTPPLRMEEWEITESVKQKRRAGMIDEDLDVKQLDPKDLDMMDEDDGDAEEGRLLDLYICCQCSLYCVASGVIPGVIPRKCFDEFIRDKRANPPAGQSGEASIAAAFETIIRSVFLACIAGIFNELKRTLQDTRE